MGRFLIFSIFTSVLCCCLSYKYEEFYFSQKVDHFGFANQDYYKQRYLINMDFYNQYNGTILFYTGNEGDIEMFANNTGFMWEYAEYFRAGLVFAEHRYYGKSLPYGKDSYTDNKFLGYLTSEQALADFAYLIDHIKTEIPGSGRAPFIAFGGSYGGMLATWIRIKYPHLIHGAIASSAPILQFQGLTPCGKFSEIVTEDFKQAGTACAKSIRRSWDVIRKFGQSVSGVAFLTEIFKLCKPLQTSTVSSLIDWLSGTWSYLAMTDYPYPTNFLNPLPGHPIKEACKYLNDETADAKILLFNIFKAAAVFHNYTGNIKCNDLNSSGGASLGEQGWDYQACTEMVQPQCQSGTTDMFEPVPWNFTDYSEKCLEKWDVRPDPKMALLIYGGENITASSNIIFTNGKLDPWYGGGVLKSLSETLIAIQIENAAHHLDLRSSNPADPSSVKMARQSIIQWIDKWICEVRKC